MVIDCNNPKTREDFRWQSAYDFYKMTFAVICKPEGKPPDPNIPPQAPPPVLLTKAPDRVIEYTIDKFTSVPRRAENKARVIEMCKDGIPIQKKTAKFCDLRSFVEAIAHIENLDAHCRNAASVMVEVNGEMKAAIPEARMQEVEHMWMKALWRNQKDEIGRWERIEDGWNDFWGDVGDLGGGMVGGLLGGLFDGIGGGKFLLIGGVVIVGLLLFTSSDRGTKTAQNVGTATGGGK